ncbi:class II histocompatibility antigen, M alpha chain [Pyxicephalus adspersus]|uniref:class II histocompatibility antigen, M alpha chain n=1 Tax=Pyxicephalus adspersus TaxID=30357 RepID=UPI003B5C3740
MLTMDCKQPIRILCSVLLALPLLAVQAQEDDHLLSQVLFCQPYQPANGLLKMFDEDQMFHYNFADHSTSAWLRDFDQWSSQTFPSAKDISADVAFCNIFRENLTTALEDIMPEARGGTHVTVFTAHPLRILKPNTLICFINDVYPPALTITWRQNGKVLSTELNANAYFALGDLTFQAFSYLNITPRYDDVYSCDVQVAGDNRTIVSYWVPDYPVPSELLENALCGLGFALGILFLILGLIILCLTKRLQDTD